MINYTWIDDKHAISCAARPFWIVKSIIVNTTFMDIEVMTLMCMILWTLCRRATTSDVRKAKVSKGNGTKASFLYHFFYIYKNHYIKAFWLSKHAFLCLTTLFDATFRVACHTVKNPIPNPTSSETPGQVRTCMFSSYSSVHHNICGPKCQSSI